ncbi:MAG: hypothetical protein WCG01_02325 [bacterium]
MGLLGFITKKWVAGEKLYASDLNNELSVRREIIDGIINTSAGYLNGGTSPSATTVFDALGQGANSGKFKISVDNAIYDNVAVNLFQYSAESNLISQLVNGGVSFILNSGAVEQMITIPAGMLQLTAFKVYFANVGGTAPVTTFEIRSGSVPGGGSVVYTQSVTITSPVNAAGWFTFTLTTPLNVTAGQTYVLKLGTCTNNATIARAQTNPYAGGQCWYNGTSYSGEDITFEVMGKTFGNHTTTTISSAVQAGIRAITCGLETVKFANGRYVITSGITGQASQVLKLMAPSSGVDISGNGGTLYLDCASHATEVAGVGHTINILGKLLGGKTLSAIAVWQALANGANNGKIKISVDGNVYDNVAIDLLNNVQTTIAGMIGNGGGSFNGGGYAGQSFLANDTGCITSITVTADYWGNGDGYMYVRNGKDMNGTIIATAYQGSPGSGTLPCTWTFATPVQVVRGQTYCFTFSANVGARFEYRSGYYSYTNGQAYNGAWQNANVQFSMSGYPWLSIATLADVAFILQSRLRLVTGSTETCVFNATANRFEITSTKAANGSILKLLAPSAGTDITGNGATSYLDCASNAIEVAGYSDYNKIAKLNDKGEIPSAVLPSGSFCAYYRNSQVSFGFGSPIKFENKIADNMNEYDPTTGKFTAKNSGVYLVTGITYLFINYSSGDMGARIGLYKNNVLYQSQGTNEIGGTIITDLTYSFVIQLSAGDQIFISNTAGAYADAWANGNAQATLNIVRII